MKKSIFLFALILPLIFACREKTTPKPQGENKAAPISFEAPAVGQQSIYLAYVGQNDRSNGPTPLTYTGDTLHLTMVSQSGNTFTAEARYSQSADTFTYLFNFRNDSLVIELSPGTTGFPKFIDFGFLPAALPLAPISSPQLSLTYADLSQHCFGATCFAHTLNHVQLGKTYPSLNLTAYYGDMAFDGPGHYIIYSKAEGIVRSTTVNAWTKGESGWDLWVQDQ